MRPRFVVGIAVALLFLSSERVPAIEDTATLSPRQAGIEVQGRYAHDTHESRQRLASKLTVGIAASLHASIEGRVSRVDGEDADATSGIADTFVDVRYRLIDEGRHVPALALIPSLRIPTGDADRGLGSPGFDAGVLIAASKNLSPLALIGNAGWTATTGESEGAAGAWSLAVAIRHQLGADWSLLAESSSTIPAHGGATSLMRAGIAWAIYPWLQTSFDVAGGLTPESPDLVTRLTLNALVW